MPCGFYPNALRPHGLHLSHVMSTPLNTADFAGQPAVPHDQIPHKEDPLEGCLTWIFLFLVFATKHVWDEDEELEDEENVGIGKLPSGTGRHPCRK